VSELAHYGVKGMHWGVRKAPRAAGYTDKQRRKDRVDFGVLAPRRINKKMLKGKTLEEAHKAERRRAAIQIGVAAGVYGAAYAAAHVAKWAPVGIQFVQAKANAERGRAASAAMRGLPFKASNGPTFAKPGKGGAYKIRSF
jgi:hypothetical protein